MKHSEFLWTSFAFGHLSANVRVRCSDFSKLRVYAGYLNRRPPSLFGKHCGILRWWTLRKTLKRWWGRLEKRRRQSPAEMRRWQDRERRDRRSRRFWGRDRRWDGCNGWWRDGGNRWGNVYGWRGVRIWWGRDGRDDSGSEAVTESDDDEVWRVVWVMRRQPQHCGRTLICQVRVRPHGPLINASGSSAYEIFARSSPMSCLPCWWRKPTGTMTRLLLH